MLTRNTLKSLIESHDLEFFGVVLLGVEPRFADFEQFLNERRDGGLNYLREYLDVRKDSRLILENAKCAIIIGLPYNCGDKFNRGSQFGKPRIAQYARFRDYHKILKQKGTLIAQELASIWQKKLGFRVVSDSAPLLERALAERTLAGFIGKNTCFIHPQKGSLFCLAEIIIDQMISDIDSKIAVEPTKRSNDGGCGSCRRCQVNCPTKALASDYKIDASKCLSYYSIEHRGLIPFEYWPFFRWYWYGCDICQLVCPYNRQSIVAVQKYKTWVQEQPLFEVATMTQKSYELMFGGTPMTRAKIFGLQRNALIAMFVTDDKQLEEAIAVLEHREETHPIVLATIEQIRMKQMKPAISDKFE